MKRESEAKKFKSSGKTLAAAWRRNGVRGRWGGERWSGLLDGKEKLSKGRGETEREKAVGKWQQPGKGME